MSSRSTDGGDLLVVGTTSAVREVAERLAESRSLTFVTDEPLQAKRAERAGMATILTSFEAGITDALTADVAVVATDRDSKTLLVAQQLRIRHDVGAVIARVNDSSRVPAFDDVATETVTTVDLYHRGISETLHGALG